MGGIKAGGGRFWGFRPGAWGIALALLAFSASGCAQATSSANNTSGTSAQSSTTAPGSSGPQAHISVQLTPGTTGNTSTSQTTSGGTVVIPTHPGQVPAGPVSSGSGQTPTGGGQPSGTPATGNPSGGGQGSGGSGSGAQPTATATSGTSTPTLYDDAVATGPLTPQAGPNTAYVTFYLTVQNTGTTTWGANPLISYKPVCVSGCPETPNIYGYGDPSAGYGSAITPGNSFSFAVEFMWTCSQCITTVFHTHWRMYRFDNTGIPGIDTPFGADIPLDVTESDETQPPIVQEPTPTCNGAAGLTWTTTNGGNGNTVSCTGSGLYMQQGQASAPFVFPTVNVTGFSPANSYTHVHIHFNSSDTTTFAGFALDLSRPCGGERVWITSSGYWEEYESVMFYGQTTCTNLLLYSGSLPASSDYDLEQVILNGIGMQGFYIDGRSLPPISIPGTNVPGLTVQSTSGNSSSGVNFSQFAVYEPNPTDWVTTQLV